MVTLTLIDVDCFKGALTTNYSNENALEGGFVVSCLFGGESTCDPDQQP